MSEPSIGADLDQAADVAIDFSAQVSLDLEVSIKNFAKVGDLGLGEVADLLSGVDARFLKKLDYIVLADAVDQRKRILRRLVSGEVDTCDTCHLVRSFSVSP